MEKKIKEVSMVRAYQQLKSDYKKDRVMHLFNEDIQKASIAHIVQKMNKITVMEYAAKFDINEKSVYNHKKHRKLTYERNHNEDYDDGTPYCQKSIEI